jgi:hypothetical protein
MRQYVFGAFTDLSFFYFRPLSKSFCGGPIPSLKRPREPNPSYANQVWKSQSNTYIINYHQIRPSEIGNWFVQRCWCTLEAMYLILSKSSFRNWIHVRTISLRFLGIILRVFRLVGIRIQCLHYKTVSTHFWSRGVGE